MRIAHTEQFALITPDQRDWDRFVTTHPSGHALQSSSWGALKGKYGWRPHLLAVMSPAGIRAGALMLLQRRYGVAAAYTPRGPLFCGDQVADQLLLDGLARAARTARAVFLRIEPNILEDAPLAGELHSALLLRQFQPIDPIQPRSSIHLGLEAEPDRLLAGMSKGHRADVKRSIREGVAVRAGEGAADLEAFYGILESTSRRSQFGIHERGYYTAALECFGDAARLWLAERGGAVEATALTIAYGNEALYLYSGSTAAGLESGAQHAIQWEVIRWARAWGCSRYDFWGVPDSLGQSATEPDPAARARLEEAARGDPLFGVYRFKKGFGGHVVRYLPAYDRVLIPPLYAIWQRMAPQ
jgi:serine/alanine adding enzyme